VVKKIVIYDDDIMSNVEIESEIIRFSESKKVKIEHQFISLKGDKGPIIDADLVFFSYDFCKNDIDNFIEEVRRGSPGAKIVVLGGSELTDGVLFDLAQRGIKQLESKPLNQENITALLEGVF